jgi:hypothetical protein
VQGGVELEAACNLDMKADHGVHSPAGAKRAIRRPRSNLHIRVNPVVRELPSAKVHSTTLTTRPHVDPHHYTAPTVVEGYQDTKRVRLAGPVGVP